jgi:small-conductance mechanosensitive channel
VLLFFGAIYVAFWVARSMRVILSDELLPKMSLPRGVANSVATLTYYALVLLGLLVALAASGFEVGQFAIVFGALGVGIGFGLQKHRQQLRLGAGPDVRTDRSSPATSSRSPARRHRARDRHARDDADDVRRR